jgi:hypothetical protein
MAHSNFEYVFVHFELPESKFGAVVDYILAVAFMHAFYIWNL